MADCQAAAVSLAAGFALVAGHADRFAVAQPQPKQVDPKKEKEKDTRSPRAAGSPFNFHVVRDAGPRLKAARDYIGFKEVPWNTVCPLVQNILDGPDSFYDPDIDDPRGAVSNRTWGGVQHEAEQILAAHPGVADVAGIGLPHPDLGEVLIALVVPRDPAAPPEPEALQAWCEERLSRFKCPREIRLVTTLDRTDLGKLDKRALRTAHT